MWWIVGLIILGLMVTLFAEALPDLLREAGGSTGRARRAVRYCVHGVALAVCGTVVLWAIYHCVTSLR